jgi:exopolysaccharide production protein ExoQ
MATAIHLNAETRETSFLKEISCWMAILPILFITANGRIETDASPIAFRFTAMAEDSFARRIVRLACSLLIIYLLSTRMRAILSLCRQSKLLLLPPAIAFASILWSRNPSHTLVDSLNLLLTTLFSFYIYLRYPEERLVSLLNMAAFLSLLLCVLTVVFFPSVGLDANQQGAWRGIFGQKNNCSTVCALFLVVGLHARSRGLIDQLVRIGVIFLSALFIIMSNSRTGWIVAILAIALTYGVRFIARIRSLDRLLLLLLLIVPFVFAAISIHEHFNSILAAMDKDPTMTQRTIIWAETLPSIAKHPFLGYGYSAFWAGLNGESMHAVLATGWMEGQAQDGYLEVLLELGVLGLIPLIALFLRALWQALKAMERKQMDGAVLLAIVMIPVVLVENIGESFLLDPLGIPWFYVLLSLLTLCFTNIPVEER